MLIFLQPKVCKRNFHWFVTSTMFQLSFCCFRKIDLFNDADDWWLWPALTVPRFNSNDKWPRTKPWTLLSPISPLVARCSLNELASWMIIHQTHKHVCMLLYNVHSLKYKVQNNEIILICLSRSRSYDLPWSIFKNFEPFGPPKLGGKKRGKGDLCLQLVWVMSNWIVAIA